MIFSSYTFIFLFLPISLVVYYFTAKVKISHTATIVSLVFLSLVFYSAWKLLYLPLLLGSILINYYIGKRIQSYSGLFSLNRKWLLILGVAINVVCLGYFKYLAFTIETINYILDTKIAKPNILLPLAISFFTFQQIAYLADCYSTKFRAYTWSEYFLFVSFFPQLIAGPIVHHTEMMPQFRDKNTFRFSYKSFYIGMTIFSIGFFKKVVIADNLSAWATTGFSSISDPGLLEAWFAALSYTMQLYYDFSGYADMAIGAALFFNIKLPDNFNSPYKAQNIQDFWRRWHMTLSRWLRDYIYIPLGGSRHSGVRTYINLMATFLIGGIWHGAGWTFILWGGMHGLGLCVHRAFRFLPIKLPKLISVGITFIFVVFSWVLFRAGTTSDAMSLWKGMIGFNGISIPAQMGALKSILVGINISTFDVDNLALFALLVLFAFITAFIAPNTIKIRSLLEQERYLLMFTILGTIAFSMSILNLANPTEFLYFNF